MVLWMFLSCYVLALLYLYVWQCFCTNTESGYASFVCKLHLLLIPLLQFLSPPFPHPVSSFYPPSMVPLFSLPSPFPCSLPLSPSPSPPLFSPLLPSTCSHMKTCHLMCLMELTRMCQGSVSDRMPLIVCTHHLVISARHHRLTAGESCYSLPHLAP